ncbi:hypothetical protein BDR26DRAFT_896455 [Obelidium mucronatum]|nr:hypothetical protein BDR26DRAFT_896455 [Obelidium mucronatum]
MIHSFKKIKSQLRINHVDPRVSQLEKKTAELALDLEKLQDTNSSQLCTIASNAARIQDLESLVEQTRQDASRRLNEADRLRRSELACLGAKASEDLLSLKAETDEKLRIAQEDMHAHVLEVKAQFEKERQDLIEAKNLEMMSLKEAAIAEWEERLYLVQEERDKIQAMCSEKTNQLAKAERQLAEKDLFFAAKREELFEAGKKAAKIKFQSSEMTNEIDRLTNRLSVQLAEVLELRQVQTTLSRSLEEKEVIIENLNDQLKEQSAVITSLGLSLDESRKETQNAKLLHSNTESTLKSTQNQVETLQLEVQTLKDSITQLNTKLSDRKQAYKESIASTTTYWEDTVKRTKSEVQNELESKHALDIQDLVETHQAQMRQLRKEFAKSGMDQTSEAQMRVDEMETRVEEMKRSNAREMERVQRKIKAELEGDIRDLEAKVEESEEIGNAWKRDAERLQKALHRAIEVGKLSLRDFEKDVDSERDLWETEKRSMKGKIHALEARLLSISETLKVADQTRNLPDDLHKSIMAATVVQAKEPEKPHIPRKQARMSDVSDLLEISAKVGKSIPKKKVRAAASRRYETQRFDSDEEGEELGSTTVSDGAGDKAAKRNESVATSERIESTQMTALAEPVAVSSESEGSIKTTKKRGKAGKKASVEPVDVPAEDLEAERQEVTKPIIASESEGSVKTTTKRGKAVKKASVESVNVPTEDLEVEPAAAVTATIASEADDSIKATTKRSKTGKKTSSENRGDESEEESTSSVEKPIVKKKAKPATDSLQPKADKAVSVATADAGKRKKAALEGDDEEGDDQENPKTMKPSTAKEEAAKKDAKKKEVVKESEPDVVVEAVAEVDEDKPDDEDEEEMGHLEVTPQAAVKTKVTVKKPRKKKEALEMPVKEKKPLEKSSKPAKEKTKNTDMQDADVVSRNDSTEKGKENKGREKKASKRKSLDVEAGTGGAESNDDNDPLEEPQASQAEKKKRKLSAKPTPATDADEMAPTGTNAVNETAAPVIKLGLQLPQSPAKKPLFSFSKPSLSSLAGFQLTSNPYNLGTSIDTSVVSDYDRQRKKRMELLIAGQSQS